MDFFFILLAVLLVIIGFIGAVVPGLPGPPLSFAALVAVSFVTGVELSAETLMNFGGVALFITVFDYYVPIIGAKLFGGSRYGVWGSILGLIFALVVLPFAGIVIGPFGLIGLIIGPFAGALIGELLAGYPMDKAIKAAIGTFAGFLAGTLVKLVYAAVTAWFLIKTLIKLI